MRALFLCLACCALAALASATFSDTNASLPSSARMLSAGQLGDAFQLLSQYSYGTIGECPDKFKMDIPTDAHASDGFYTIPYSSIKIDLGGWTLPSLNANEFTGVECSGPQQETGLRLQRGETVTKGTFVRDHAQSSSTLTLYESLSDRFPNGNYWTSPLTVAPFNCSKGGAWPETAWFREGFTFLFFREEETVPITFIGKVRSDGTERLIMLNMTGTIRYMIASAAQTTCIYRAMLDVERLINKTIDDEVDANSNSTEMTPTPSVSLSASPSVSSSASMSPSASSSSQPSLAPHESPSVSPSLSVSPSISASQSMEPSESPSSSPTGSPVAPSCDCVCSPQQRERERRREERRKKRLEKIKPGGPWYGPAVPTSSPRQTKPVRFPFTIPGFFKGNNTSLAWSWICCRGKKKKGEAVTDGDDAGESDAGNAVESPSTGAGESTAGNAVESPSAGAGESTAGNAVESPSAGAGESTAGNAVESPSPGAGESTAGNAVESPSPGAGESTAGSAVESPSAGAGESTAGTAVESPSAGAGDTKAEADADADEGVRGGSACYPGSSIVRTRTGAKRVELLQVGDEVLSARGQYSRVFLFTHRLKDVESEFVLLRTKRGRMIALSADHLLRAGRRGLVAADRVVVGDVVTSVGRNDEELDDSIVSVTHGKRNGLYNAHTEAGSIVVDGVLVSCYTRLMPAFVGHLLLAPVRLLARFGYYPVGAKLERGAEPLGDYYKSLPNEVRRAVSLPRQILESGASVFKRIVIASDPWLQWV